MAVPLRICLDLGHRNMNGLIEETDHLAWIRRYGVHCDVIDCQQTTMKSSDHWPFTTEKNRLGIIKGEEVAKAIKDIPSSKEILLAFEIRTSAFWPQENDHLRGLQESVEYWRQWVKD